MKSKLFIAAVLVSLALPATADFKTVELAYEAALSGIRIPRNETGTISFKECAKCEYKTKRVTASTRYEVNGRAITLEKFRQILGRISDRENHAVTVLHHLKDNRVTAVSVYL